MSRKLALIIGNGHYDDAGLARLPAAQVDVRELAELLKSPEVGQFDDVITLADQGLSIVRRTIARFFSQARRDDLLVFYFSGHGIKDDQGSLYFAVKDTERELLAGTSIEAAFVTAQMDRSYSKRQVLILDCCHSGAFAHGAKGTAEVVGTGPAFEGTGYGRVVLTATDSTQFAWQGDEIIGDSDNSVFTHYLLEGLKTGEADQDGDGLITIDELSRYVFEHVINETPKQTPGKWSYKQQGDIVIAQNPHYALKPAELPPEVRALLDSPFPRLRLEAIPELARLLESKHPGLALAARNALTQLGTDDSRRVSAAAEEILAKLPPVAPAAPVKPPDRSAEPIEAAEAARKALEREEAERIRRERVASATAAVEGCLASGDFDRAALELEKLTAAFPDAPGLGELRNRLEDARRHDEARRRQEAELRAREEQAAADEARRRRESVERLLAEATERQARQDLDGALAQVQAALEIDRDNAAAIALGKQVRRALQELRARQEQAAQHLDRARAAIQAGNFSEAIDLLRAGQQLDPDAKGLAVLLRDAESGQAAADEARQRRESVERLVAEASARQARQDLDGALEQVQAALEIDADHAAAIALGKQVRRTLQELRARQAKAAQHLDRARAAIQAGNFSEAIDLLGAGQQLDPDAKGLAALLRDAESGQAAAADEARRRQEEERRALQELRARQEQAAQHLDRARAAIQAGNFSEAIDLLHAVRQLDPDAKGLAALLREAESGQAAADEARTRRESVDRLLTDASQRQARQDLEGALARVRAALEIDPDQAVARALGRQLEAAIEEARRQEQLEREARARQKKVDELIATAARVTAHEPAIRALREALALDPDHSEASRLLAQRTAALEEEARERERQRQMADARTSIAGLLARDDLDGAEQAIVAAETKWRDPAAFEEPRRRLSSARHDRQALSVIEEARREFSSGNQLSAVATLERFHPPHPAVASALAAFNAEIKRQREEQERLEQRRQQAQRKLTDAAGYIERRRFSTAESLIAKAALLDPENAAASELTQKIAGARAEGVVELTLPGQLSEVAVRGLRESRLVQLGLVAVLIMVAVMVYRALPSTSIGPAGPIAPTAGPSATAPAPVAEPTREGSAGTSPAEGISGTTPVNPPSPSPGRQGAAASAGARGDRPPSRADDPGTSTARGRGRQSAPSGPTGARGEDTVPATGATPPPPEPAPTPSAPPVESKPVPPVVVAPSRAELVSEAEKAIKERRFQAARGVIDRLDQIEPADPAVRQRLLHDVADGEVRQAVEAYSAAYSSRDHNAVRAIHPTVPSRELSDLDKLRKDFKTYEMRITIKKINFEQANTRARVECAIFHNFITFAGKSDALIKNDDLTFERKGGSWVRVR